VPRRESINHFHILRPPVGNSVAWVARGRGAAIWVGVISAKRIDF